MLPSYSAVLTLLSFSDSFSFCNAERCALVSRGDGIDSEPFPTIRGAHGSGGRL
jgi:hypothetical protein